MLRVQEISYSLSGVWSQDLRCWSWECSGPPHLFSAGVSETPCKADPPDFSLTLAVPVPGGQHQLLASFSLLKPTGPGPLAVWVRDARPVDPLVLLSRPPSPPPTPSTLRLPETPPGPSHPETPLQVLLFPCTLLSPLEDEIISSLVPWLPASLFIVPGTFAFLTRTLGNLQEFLMPPASLWCRFNGMINVEAFSEL